jgi:hypothetical protein
VWLGKKSRLSGPSSGSQKLLIPTPPVIPTRRGLPAPVIRLDVGPPSFRPSGCTLVQPEAEESLFNEKFLRVEGVLQNQDHTLSIKASRVLPISITAAETQSHDFH